jgi:hypothetical protein
MYTQLIEQFKMTQRQRLRTTAWSFEASAMPSQTVSLNVVATDDCEE